MLGIGGILKNRSFQCNLRLSFFTRFIRNVPMSNDYAFTVDTTGESLTTSASSVEHADILRIENSVT